MDGLEAIDIDQESDKWTEKDKPEDFSHKNANFMIVINKKWRNDNYSKGYRRNEHDKERDDTKKIYLKSESIVLYLQYCPIHHDTANLYRNIRDL